MRIAVYDPRLPRLLNNAQGNLGTAVQLAVALSSAGCAVELLHNFSTHHWNSKLY